MDELTTEQKAKRFDEVLAMAKQFLTKELYAECNGKLVECLFPELKEDKDERIRLYLIECFTGAEDCAPNIKGRDVVDWLEKQGEKDVRQKFLEDLLVADDIYQMAMNDTMVEEARTKAIEAISKIGISQLLGITKPDGVYPEERGVRIWKDGHTFLVPKDWNKGEWPLLNDEGYERSKKNKERLMTEVEALLDWNFVAGTKQIQELGTDIPLKEGECMITAPVHMAMYEYRHELNKALCAMGAEEINFDKDCWFAQRCSANFAWLFGAYYGYLYNGSVNYTYQVRAVSL